MRRATVILMLFTGVVTIIAGIAEASPRHHGLPVFHIVVGTIFAILCLIHALLNRRAIAKYFRGGKRGF